jgi:hypothetical protein
VKLSKPQRKVLSYLAGRARATEKRIAKEVFDAPKSRMHGTPMLLGVPSVMRALEARRLVKLRPERGLMGGRSWEITAAGRKAVNDGAHA